VGEITLRVSRVTPFLVDLGGGKNLLFVKVFVNFEARGREIASPGFEVRDGYIAVPQSPGLGIELDEAVLARHPGRQFPPRALPSPADEGP